MASLLFSVVFVFLRFVYLVFIFFFSYRAISTEIIDIDKWKSVEIVRIITRTKHMGHLTRSYFMAMRAAESNGFQRINSHRTVAKI